MRIPEEVARGILVLALLVFFGGVSLGLTPVEPSTQPAATALGMAHGITSYSPSPNFNSVSSPGYPIPLTCFMWGNWNYKNVGYPYCNPGVGIYGYVTYPWWVPYSPVVAGVFSAQTATGGLTKIINATYNPSGEMGPKMGPYQDTSHYECFAYNDDSQCIYWEWVPEYSCKNYQVPPEWQWVGPGGTDETACYAYRDNLFTFAEGSPRGSAVSVAQGQSVNLQWSCAPYQTIQQARQGGPCLGSTCFGGTYLVQSTEYIFASGASSNFGASGGYGNRTVTPTSNTTYTLTCSGNGRSQTLSIPVTVTTPPPPPCTSAPNACGMTTQGTIQNGVCSAQTPPNSSCPPPPLPTTCSGNNCNLECTPDSVFEGGSAVCTWSCDPATYSSALGDGFSTGGARSGSATVTVQDETLFRLTCVAPDGQRTTDAEVVQVGLPELSLTATPSRVRQGNSATINWSAANVILNTCRLSSTGGLSVAAPSGSQSVVISAQTIFTLSCNTPAGPVSTSVTVNVLPIVEEI